MVSRFDSKLTAILPETEANGEISLQVLPDSDTMQDCLVFFFVVMIRFCWVVLRCFGCFGGCLFPNIFIFIFFGWVLLGGFKMFLVKHKKCTKTTQILPHKKLIKHAQNQTQIIPH